LRREEARDLRERGKHITNAWRIEEEIFYPALGEPARLRDLEQEALHGHDIVNNLVTNEHAELTRQIRGLALNASELAQSSLLDYAQQQGRANGHGSKN
jgi:hypothetical protein